MLSVDYQNSSNRAFTLNHSIDLSNMEAAKVTFYAKWEIETDYDMCQFQVSTDGGTNWVAQCGKYTTIATNDEGVQVIGEPKWDNSKSNWVQEEINLSDYLGQTIKVRFILRADGGVRRDGFYFDDIKITAKEIEVVDPGTDVSIQAVDAENIFIYPNPSNGIITISGFEEKQQIEIFDLRGVVVHTDFVLADKDQVNVAHLSSGTYLVKIGHSEKKVRLVLM